ncbi:MAG: bifunctional phosphoribosylaminoimidazolecarboxamide formyltransferase/IMP cyclohydrolase PurH [Planctomycetota bacterium]|nr:MAG: bifunctional phosphoribosylaminoimidazolecarboxamide formyltransferase/IMP cyclohydrolase PurH [Planctomycetota bacterium]REJ86688.1 MAG: bifunctional phosphoribosylaminoimidazolecarboxamide formyltransferase/IMP cyclohydrolase PurH [Planctomycetota bacterium]REK27140.1 MAG: bifunctional phosphoribosylaminoimidazolecarboxamide formyltransferase/IMP cyclohydrolase PurH [Planctomycetota bacterium]REK37864.1 MAG: bifunctional phosphoribosylaminoimidazolecarboxamide formyltransferase/IMP cyc
MTSPRIERALLSVSDKTGLVEFAQGLAAAGVELLSTGGTRRHLEEAGLSVRDVAEYTGFPEMMEGRLKTLHPKVHGGILARHDRPDDLVAMAEHDIAAIPLVVVNLYPFEATVARADVTLDEAVENIDIGGPTMVRAAAKNYRFTTIASDPSQYPAILEQVAESGATTLELRRELMEAAFAHTARYDRAIADYFARQSAGEAAGPFPASLSVSLDRQAVLRYGENPHQQAALYRLPATAGANLLSAELLGGKELSYNNLLDLNSALAIARDLPDAGAVVIKHTNPCGAAAADSLAAATEAAFAGDPVSAFGSVLGFNQTLDAATAECLAEPGKFVEAIVAPSFSDEALEILRTRPKWRNNVRLLAVCHHDGDPHEADQQEGERLAGAAGAVEFRHIDGGLLAQESDNQPDRDNEWKVVTDVHPSDAQVAELRFAWTIVRHVKSNAIVLAKDRALRGAGAGQMSRVDSVEIAIRKAGEHATGSVLASDAFFPFADSIEVAHAAGVVAVIQPGGSKRDDEVIAACNEKQLPMIFTGRRHFKH